MQHQATEVEAILLGLTLYCLAALAGLLIGWSWRPRWFVAWSLGARRFCFCLDSILLRRIRSRRRTCCSRSSNCKVSSSKLAAAAVPRDDAEDEQSGVTEADLETLISHLDGTDGGPPWQLIMERSNASVEFQAWYRDPEFGPRQYRTRTVIENASPDLMRDFFWDDEFRTKWDELHIYFKIQKECHHTGTMIVHWIRKFPFFCSDREYIIVRRIWESGSTYYCVTKYRRGYFCQGTPYRAVPRRRKPKRVDFYFSNWRIKAVEERNGGQMTASEVVLFHHEEIGIPKELVKIAIQRRMWSLVKTMDVGVRAYQVERTSGAPLSRYAFMARIGTKIPSRFLLPRPEPGATSERFEPAETSQKSKQGKALKWLVVAGVLLVCGLNREVIGKGIAFVIDKGFKRDRNSSSKKTERSQFARGRQTRIGLNPDS